VPLDPAIRRIVEGLGDDRAEAPTDFFERRRQADQTMMLIHPGPQPGVEYEDRTIPVDGGEITVRLMRPAALDGPMPTLVYLHGGGWTQGNLDTSEVECGPLASVVPCLVVSVGYRLAPEHPFPAPLHDCVAAYEWVLAHHEELRVDLDRVAVGGGSAGGNLAAALCLVARDRGLPLPCFQLLDMPAFDLTMASPSFDEHGHPGFDREAIGAWIDMYLGGAVEATHPRVSPLFEPDLRGLPPALISVGELDPVRDDGERYLARLHEADVPAVGLRVLSHPHGGWIIPVSATWRLMGDLRAAAVRRAFDGTLVPFA
jgi:acetyl esterase